MHFDEDDENALVRLNERMVKGCFLRMGFTGDINQALLHKAYLSLQWKYFAHIMLHCLGNCKSGHDVMRFDIQSAMVALVLNRPYNFSRLIWDCMKENI